MKWALHTSNTREQDVAIATGSFLIEEGHLSAVALNGPSVLGCIKDRLQVMLDIYALIPLKLDNQRTVRPGCGRPRDRPIASKCLS